MRAAYIIVLALFFISLTLQQTDQEIADKNVNWNTLNGIQMLLISTNDVHFYVSFTGDSNSITGVASLYTKWTQAELDQQPGLYAGIGWGTNVMANNDMFTLHYWPNRTPNFMVGDCWVDPANNRVVKLDKEFSGNDSDDNITSSDFSLTTVDINNKWKTRLRWTFTKNIANPDQYDWSDSPNWQTNKGPVIAAWGWKNDQGMMTKHVKDAHDMNIEDGLNLNSMTDNTNIMNSDTMILENKLEWGLIPGIQMKLIDTSAAVLYVSFDGNSGIISGDATLYLSSDLNTLNSQPGVYAGIGWGTNVMANNDMFTLHYWPNRTPNFMVGDCGLIQLIIELSN